VDVAYFRTLLDYNRWATAKIIDRARELSDEEYRRSLPGLAYASIHGCLVHIAGGETQWLARWQNITPTERLTEADLPAFDDVVRHLSAIEDQMDAFLATLSDDDLTTRKGPLPGPPPVKTRPLGYLIAHVVIHGTQFRSEAAVALTALDHSPGNLDLGIYLRE
jgi:uncharacterized damage-inducible protein DinB